MYICKYCGAEAHSSCICSACYSKLRLVRKLVAQFQLIKLENNIRVNELDKLKIVLTQNDIIASKLNEKELEEITKYLHKKVKTI